MLCTMLYKSKHVSQVLKTHINPKEGKTKFSPIMIIYFSLVTGKTKLCFKALPRMFLLCLVIDNVIE